MLLGGKIDRLQRPCHFEWLRFSRAVVGGSPVRYRSRRVRLPAMDRPPAFASFRYLGDRRTQIVYDLDDVDASEVVDEIVESENAVAFAPDTLAEARNRGYRHRVI